MVNSGEIYVTVLSYSSLKNRSSLTLYTQKKLTYDEHNHNYIIIHLYKWKDKHRDIFCYL